MKANIGHSPGVVIDKSIAEKMLSWHSGGGDPIYAAGSAAYAGHLAQPQYVAGAISNLKKDLPLAEKGKHGWGPDEVEELEKIIDHLEDALEDYRSDLHWDMETAATMIANEEAVETLSYIDQDMPIIFGRDVEHEDLWVIAESGDAVAVNGELVYGAEGEPSLRYGDPFLAQQAVKPPKGFVETNYGGWAGGQSAGIREDTLGYVISELMGHDKDDGFVEETIEEFVKENRFWESGSDTSYDVWANPKVIDKEFLKRGPS